MDDPSAGQIPFLSRRGPQKASAMAQKTHRKKKGKLGLSLEIIETRQLEITGGWPQIEMRQHYPMTAIQSCQGWILQRTM